MASMASMGLYGVYVALLQTPIEGPGFADDSGPGSRRSRTRLRTVQAKLHFHSIYVPVKDELSLQEGKLSFGNEMMSQHCVTIFTLHCTFPHSCLYLPPVAGRSLYTNISSYLLLLIAYSGVAMHSLLTHAQHAQHAYLCTAFLYSI